MAHVTTMVLKADLQCCKCYKKVKEVLCRFDQIQDQVYDEKNNTVTIKVICYDLEKMKHKIISKGKGVIKCIEIKVKPPPAPPQIPVPPPPPPPPPERVLIPVPCVLCVPVCPPAGTCRPTCCNECYKGRPGGPCFDGPNIGGNLRICEGHWRCQEYCSEPSAECSIM